MGAPLPRWTEDLVNAASRMTTYRMKAAHLLSFTDITIFRTGPVDVNNAKCERKSKDSNDGVQKFRHPYI